MGEKRIPYLTLFSLAVFLGTVLAISAGCSGRLENPVTGPDSTILYPPKDPGGVTAKITFCRNINKRTGNLIGEGTSFTIRENENIRAYVNLENLFFTNQRNLMFHFDWIDEQGNTVFLKRVDLSPADSTSTISSSITAEPGKRNPGRYNLRIYLFRELIAEKPFTLRSATSATAGENQVTATIALSKSKDRKENGSTAPDTTFVIREKEKVFAFADFKNLDKFAGQDLTFNFEWIDSTGKSFYQKEIEMLSGDSAAPVSSSISISPESKQPGPYLVRLFLFNDLIGEQKFTLIPEPEEMKALMENIRARITFFRKLDKKTGEKVGVDTVFTIRDKQSVRASVDIESGPVKTDQELQFKFIWNDAGGKPVYRKEIVIKPHESVKELNSSISISPDKRKPGHYSLQLFLFSELLAEKGFDLLPGKK